MLKNISIAKIGSVNFSWDKFLLTFVGWLIIEENSISFYL